ncbi:170_t:CDS:2, partial [Entrophospora sp. SA101]
MNIIIEGIVVDNDDILEFEEDWEEFVEQLQQMLMVFIIPWLGRWLAWSRFTEWALSTNPHLDQIYH